MQAFGGLWSLPDDDPLWSAEEEPLPAEAGDYVKVFPQPGWVVTAANGEVQRFNAGSVKTHSYGAKYAKLVYSTLHPFNVGLSGGFSAPDSTLSLADGEMRGARTRNLAYAVGQPGWLRLRWEQELNGHTHLIETVMVVRGAMHIRAHRLLLDPNIPGPLQAIEGGAPLGYIQGDAPFVWRGPKACAAGTMDRVVMVRGLRGYDGARLWSGDPGINSVYPFAVVPTLTIDRVPYRHNLLCLVYSGGTLDPNALLRTQVRAEWRADGSFWLVWDGDEWVVPALDTKG
jgi:hypothetical protein